MYGQQFIKPTVPLLDNVFIISELRLNFTCQSKCLAVKVDPSRSSKCREHATSHAADSCPSRCRSCWWCWCTRHGLTTGTDGFWFHVPFSLRGLFPLLHCYVTLLFRLLLRYIATSFPFLSGKLLFSSLLHYIAIFFPFLSVTLLFRSLVRYVATFFPLLSVSVECYIFPVALRYGALLLVQSLLLLFVIGSPI